MIFLFSQISRPLHKKVPDQHICMHPTIPSVVPIEPRHIPTIQNSARLHSFHIRTHHKHLYTDLGPITRILSQKSAGPAYVHAAHNSKCGTNRSQAHPHNTKQCTFCTHFTFALTRSTYTPNWALKFLDHIHKKVPDQHICMHPTIPSVVPIEPRHIPTMQNSALFTLISHSHSL